MTGFGAAIHAGWNAAWSGLSDAFLGLTVSIQSTVASVWDPLSAYLSGAFENWGAWADSALAAIQSAISTGMETLNKSLTEFMGVVGKGWTDFGAVFNGLITGIADTVIEVVTAASGKLGEILAGMISAAQSAAATIAGILSGIGASIQGAMNQAGTAAGDAGSAIVNGITGALDTVADAATDFYNWLTGHSLWPDLMGSLVSQTEAGMADVMKAFEGGFGGITLAAPTIPDLITRTQVTPAQRSAETATAQSPAGMMQSISVPVTVQVDGATVARTVEKRLISSRNLSAWGAR
jgi:phage-related protein